MVWIQTGQDQESGLKLVYFSGASGFTHRFVQKLDVVGYRIPIHEDFELVEDEFLLILPTYGTPDRPVPPQVIKFLNEKQNRSLLRGVIGAGNTNFNQNYCRAAYKVSEKCRVPVLYKFELSGTPEDVNKVKDLII